MRRCRIGSRVQVATHDSLLSPALEALGKAKSIAEYAVMLAVIGVGRREIRPVGSNVKQRIFCRRQFNPVTIDRDIVTSVLPTIPYFGLLPGITSLVRKNFHDPAVAPDVDG